MMIQKKTINNGFRGSIIKDSDISFPLFLNFSDNTKNYHQSH